MTVEQQSMPAPFPSFATRMPYVLVALVLTTAALYLGVVIALGSELAYPLDDSWIHQTFARNLLLYGGFVYNPGESSSASTSPLWTLLLAPGYLLGIDHRVWAYLLGLLFLTLTGLLVRDIFQALYPGHRTWAAVAGVGVVLEPHLAWAALSGMETILFIVLSLLLVRAVLCSPTTSPCYSGQSPGHSERNEESQRPRERGLLASLRMTEGKGSQITGGIGLGLLGGLLTVTRPEGILLFALGLAFCGAGLLLRRVRRYRRTDAPAPAMRQVDLWVAVLAFVVLLTPYLVFNFGVTGQPFPSTYYAKNFAYAEQMSLVGMGRFLLLLAWELFSGPLLLLVPGLVFAVGRLAGLTWRARGEEELWPRLVSWLPLLWCAGLVAAYMIRLPAIYHHGRYLMPIIPVLLIYGLWGTLRLCHLLPMRLLAKVIPALIVVFWLARWGNGAVVYAWDVKFINDQNVAVGRWLRDNTPPDALVATHDIGAIAYVARRPILDTAGLITPEIAPFVRQYETVLRYLELRKPGYLAIYPRWYPLLPQDPRVREVYRVDHEYAIEQGADNMVIYKLGWEGGR